MERRERRVIKIEDKDIKEVRFRNLSGAPGMYDRGGSPNFWIVLNDDKAKELEDLDIEGQRLNIRWKANADQDLEPRLQLFARYDNFPPQIYKVTSKGVTLLDQDSVGSLDYDEIMHLDLEINPYHWKRPNGEEGIKAYIKTAYFTIAEDSFFDKYSDLG